MLLLSLLKLCPAERPDCVCLILLCLLCWLGLALILPPVLSFDCSFPPHLRRGCSSVLSHAGEQGLKVGIIEEKAHREPGALLGGSASCLPCAHAGSEVPGGGAGMGSATLSPGTEELAGGGRAVCRFLGTSATFFALPALGCLFCLRYHL